MHSGMKKQVPLSLMRVIEFYYHAFSVPYDENS